MNKPQIGTSAIILRDNKLLIGKRKGTRGPGTYCCPGGAVEYGEDPSDTVIRELKEETGLVGFSTRYIHYESYVNSLQEHWICMFFLVHVSSDQQPKNIEPEKNEGWEWHHLSDLRQLPMFWDYWPTLFKSSSLYGIPIL